MRVFIVGSCVSRDALAIADATDDIKLAGYNARSSLGVLPSAPVSLPDEIDSITAAWSRRMVRADHEKTLLRAVAEASFDLLLLDLIDERFNLLETPGGGVVTVSQEYAGAMEQQLTGRVIPAFGARHVTLWREGFATLIEALREQGRLDRLRVNRVFWASQTASGEPLAGFEPAEIAAANAFLRARYDDIARALGDAVFLDYAPDALRADPAHRWGLSPFHFVPEFYFTQVAALRAAGSDARKRDDAAARGPQVGAALYAADAWQRPLFDYAAGVWWPQRYALREGIHRFALPAGHTLDLLLDGLDRLHSANTLLVCFGAAVTQRAGRSAPFFSGLRTAKTLGRPVLCISDPVLAKSASIALGWYAGYRGCTDLPQRIAELLDDVAAKLAVQLLLFGGSGGGFGALAVLGYLRSPASALVWNPQTSIGRYYANSVRVYLEAAFGDAQGEAGGLKQRLEASGVQHSLLGGPPRRRHPRLYLQNRSDSLHVQHHARPYAIAVNALRVGRAAFAGDDGSAFWFGNWGHGHVPPPQKVLHQTLDRMSCGASTLAAALELDNGGVDDDPFDL